MQNTGEFAVSPQFYEDTFVQREADEVERLLDPSRRSVHPLSEFGNPGRKRNEERWRCRFSNSAHSDIRSVHLFPLLDESFMQFTDNVIFRTLAQGRSFVRRLEVQSGEFVILFVWQGPLVISAFDAVSPWSGRLRNLLHSRASGRRVPERALLAVSSTHLFRRSYALEFHAARPREGEIRRRSSDFCPSDSNSHLWLRDFDADAQT